MKKKAVAVKKPKSIKKTAKTTSLLQDYKVIKKKYAAELKKLAER